MARKKASKKKASKKKAVAKKKSTAVTSYKERLAALAEEESERKTSIGGGGNTIRLSKGSFRFQGEDLGDTLNVVVVDFAYHRNYFDRPFDEDNPCPPACYAISKTGKGMTPGDDAPDAQADECEDCWANEWQSDKRERGKACREVRLLGILSADALEDLDAISIDDVAFVRVPPSSLGDWDSYMKKRNKVLGLPALAFVTEITFDDEVDFQKLLFDEVERVPEEAYAKLFELHEEVEAFLLEPPDVTRYEPPGAAKKKASKKSKKKASKKRSKKKATKRKSRF